MKTNSFADDVQDIVEAYGKTVTYIRTSEYDRTGKGGLTRDNEEVEYTIKAAIRTFWANELEGNLIQQGTKEVRIAAKSIPFAPRMNDTIVIDGVRNRVISPDNRENDLEALIYILRVRG